MAQCSCNGGYYEQRTHSALGLSIDTFILFFRSPEAGREATSGGQSDSRGEMQFAVKFNRLN